MAAKRTPKPLAARPKPVASVPALNYGDLVTAIGQAHQSAQGHAVQAVNMALTLRNWLIGYYIFEYEQHGSDRAEYGARLLDNLAKDSRQRLGNPAVRYSGFLPGNLYAGCGGCSDDPHGPTGSERSGGSLGAKHDREIYWREMADNRL